MKRLILCTTLVAIIAMFGVTGCSTYSTGKDERSAGRAKDDEEIVSKVRDALADEPVYKFGNVQVKAYAGDVQLSGFVNTEDQKNRAGEIASQIPGVVRVHNTLVLKPFAPTPTGRTNGPQQNVIYSSPPTQQPVQNTQPAPEETNSPK